VFPRDVKKIKLMYVQNTFSSSLAFFQAVLNERAFILCHLITREILDISWLNAILAQSLPRHSASFTLIVRVYQTLTVFASHSAFFTLIITEHQKLTVFGRHSACFTLIIGEHQKLTVFAPSLRLLYTNYKRASKVDSLCPVTPPAWR
jgi:hypothetical protein